MKSWLLCLALTPFVTILMAAETDGPRPDAAAAARERSELDAAGRSELAEPERREQAEREMRMMMERREMAERERQEAGWRAAAAENLGRNVKLQFMLVPMENNDKDTYIVTASPRYATAVRFEGPGTKIAFAVNGRVTLRDDGRLFVIYSAHMEFDSGQGRACFDTESSVLLEPGKEQAVARMGEKTLVIRAAFAEEK